jgi:hypothetical protein
MSIDDEKGRKSWRLRRIEDSIFYLSYRSFVLSMEIYWVSWWNVKHQKSIIPPKTSVRSDISGIIARFQRLWPDMSDLSTLSVSAVVFQRLWPDMSSSQPGHVRPNPIPQQLSPRLDISGTQAGFQRGWPDMSSPLPGHVRVSDTSTARFSWKAIKCPSCLSNMLGHLFHIANTLR